ncbi:MAG: hypothetical protein CO113_14165 [Elusimicrobia bacterium CG_4_9_14_3_um_filter_62_55]|nr:MAG: hypothetical protein COR54_19510 [Elusimicrobia bacterium CG22_combo_CG10-13_8_21_14_all_63_91]PJB24389.1 MAG: hypothetical protein CO113_14165 [Elusimicrobia bacterium CG_4_9_14_3_um_filter_62_55]
MNPKTSLNIAFVMPDGLSVMLFAKGIIKSLRTIPNAKVFVYCDPGEYAQSIAALGVDCVSIPMYRWFSFAADLKYLNCLYRVMRRNQIDVVFNFSTKPNIFGSLAAKFAGVAENYCHVVGLGSGFESPKNPVGRLLRRIFIELYRVACGCSRKVWFTNIEDHRFFIDRNLIPKHKAVLTRNYLDTAEYAIELVDEKRREKSRELCGVIPGESIVIMVARMIWQKGVREFAEAATLLKDSNPNLKFVLVAPLEPGNKDAVPESYVREIEANANFIWLGFQRDVKALYAVSDLAVLPTYYREGGYPRALLEPMAMGKPLIATTSEHCRATVEQGRNGFLVPIKDSKALAEAIKLVFSKETDRGEFGRFSLLKAAQEFDEAKIIPEALRLLGLPVEDLLHERI